MIIVWDDIKKDANLIKHGFNFADFHEDCFIGAKFQRSYSGRFKALFYLNEMPVCLVFTSLGKEAITLISLRPASKKERQLLK